jgi:HAD superfamily hydrolase (TIGR01509 family)
MDGLLVDSEPLWHQAEVEILGGLGVPIDPDACRSTKGMFVEEVTRHWFERHPWSRPSPDEVATNIVDRVIGLVISRGVLLPGVREALARCRAHGMAMAVASSSQYRLIDAVLAHFGLADEFALVQSAEEEPFGKPHPGVFLTTAAKLGAEPARCLVFEDSGAGVLAAKAARMTCVAVPEVVERDAAAFVIADVRLDSLLDFDERCLAALSKRAGDDPK